MSLQVKWNLFVSVGYATIGSNNAQQSSGSIGALANNDSEILV